MSRNYRVVSLFSGAGGMDLGFIKVGFEIVWANDFFEDAINTYKLNIGDHIIHKDVTSINSSEIPDNIDVIIGGFPCQGFSVANTRRSIEDNRNFLYKEMLRIINDKKPAYFVAENVKGILSLANGHVFEMIKNDFRNIGYNIDAKVLNAAEFGVPQSRERVIIIGNNVGGKNIFPQPSHFISKNRNGNQAEFPSLNSNLKPAITTQEAIGFLADTHLSYKPLEINGRKIFNHIASTNVSDKFWGRKYNVNQADICDYLKYWRNKSGWSTKKVDDHFGYNYTAGHWFRKDNNSGSIPSPEDWLELKEILKFDNKYDKEVTTLVEKTIVFEQSLRITNWETPSDTITATSPEIHINKKRRLSVRECAILQTFPDDFIFTGSLNSMYKQIGNAVPVTLAERIADEILKLLKKHDN